MAAKILQIIPYFGQWPEWFDLYLYSCGRNEMIDFVYYTDCPIPKEKYANTKFVSISFSDYCKLVGNRLGFEYHIDKPYKLTDLKPFLGYVHQAELEHYEFWGFGDIDLCYGDLSMILNEKNLKKYDLITTHCYHIAGHFTIIRKNSKYTNLCLRIPNWAKLLNDSKHHALDEDIWSRMVFPSLKWRRKLWKILKPLHICNFFTFLNAINPIFNKHLHFKEYYTSPCPKPRERWLFITKYSKVIAPDGTELPYIHFLFFKKTEWFETDNYWKSGYYKLNNDISQYNKIEISLEKINDE